MMLPGFPPYLFRSFQISSFPVFLGVGMTFISQRSASHWPTSPTFGPSDAVGCTAGPNVSNVGVITLWLCQNSYWKWPLIVDFPIKNGGSFHSYVSLPEGTDSLPKESAVFVPHLLLFWGCLWANSHPNALANAHYSWATKTLFSNISCNLISYQIICKPAPIHRAWLW